MGQHYRKIKVAEEAEYASTKYNYIYVHYNDTADIALFYDKEGRYMFSDQNWKEGEDMIDRIVQMRLNRDNRDSEPLEPEDFEMLKKANNGYI